MPEPHHSNFYRPDALPGVNQQCQSAKVTDSNRNKMHKLTTQLPIKLLYIISGYIQHHKQLVH